MPRVSQEQAKLNRQRVVEVAATLFRERGLHGVGVADIMGAAGLTHGGFYGQFANKDALAAEAFETALTDNGRGQLDSLVSNYLSIAHVRAPGMGCPVAALANDVAREAPDSPVRSRFTRGVRGMVDLMAALVPKTPKQKRRQRALSSLATLVGAVVLARAVDDEALAEEILGAARASLGAEAPERDTPAGPSNSG
ncbi:MULTISPECIES: TetR/AcrR family transcriptional regulator [Methylobacterium]|jgi:TetR/AcrR family transcriptional repressor of nem operon|uniref:TetR/AcrR family transcriptional repressor of nem operon n=1 Tax=Methylobacterium fujisawaense TaxID=107400 RepID=A0ABR6DA22_9HYPH|nr:MULTISPECIES: TetR family transcriptional regulator [Methylobacterium]KOX51652.1 TetR family transcriptional regulator [Streptomyces purpurogeneiscleroticus]MBA9062954.1 TetR/AcrR family transcriptional repressor of nem operon [Methylobacterium fujisawaense]MBP32820.1 TetR family transcriptional regulator [Methylobacterium sp.]MDE4916038.1 TetR family transcriptional regulator [Methylobacterium sp. 092160098-2]